MIVTVRVFIFVFTPQFIEQLPVLPVFCFVLNMLLYVCLQCFDAVGWAAGTASL